MAHPYAGLGFRHEDFHIFRAQGFGVFQGHGFRNGSAPEFGITGFGPVHNGQDLLLGLLVLSGKILGQPSGFTVGRFRSSSQTGRTGKGPGVGTGDLVWAQVVQSLGKPVGRHSPYKGNKNGQGHKLFPEFVDGVFHVFGGQQPGPYNEDQQRQVHQGAVDDFPLHHLQSGSVVLAALFESGGILGQEIPDAQADEQGPGNPEFELPEFQFPSAMVANSRTKGLKIKAIRLNCI